LTRPAARPKPPARKNCPSDDEAKPAAEYRGQRLALLMIDEAP